MLVLLRLCNVKIQIEFNPSVVKESQGLAFARKAPL